jgi:hypothetical protein
MGPISRILIAIWVAFVALHSEPRFFRCVAFLARSNSLSRNPRTARVRSHLPRPWDVRLASISSDHGGYRVPDLFEISKLLGSWTL